MPDLFPSDFLGDVLDLKSGLRTAQGEAARRSPLTEASAGWILRSRSTPALDDLGPNDVWIYAQGGVMYARSGSGLAVPLVPVPAFPKASAISSLGSRQTTSAPGSYSSAWAGNVLSDLASLYTYTQALHTSLIAANLMFGL